MLRTYFFDADLEANALLLAARAPAGGLAGSRVRHNQARFNQVLDGPLGVVCLAQPLFFRSQRRAVSRERVQLPIRVHKDVEQCGSGQPVLSRAVRVVSWSKLESQWPSNSTTHPGKAGVRSGWIHVLQVEERPSGSGSLVAARSPRRPGVEVRAGRYLT